MAQHNELGKWGEALAVRFLQQQGYVIIDNDWKSGHRDIDIIAKDADVLVFVEVKTRSNDYFSEPVDAVNYHKMMNLRRAFNHYIKYHRVSNAVRFDIIGIVGSPEGEAPRIEHFKDIPII